MIATSCRSWLPEAAVARAARAVPLGAAVHDWSATWFAGRQAMVAGDPAFGRGVDLARDTAIGIDDMLAMLMPDQTGTVVASLMFGAPDDPDALTPADRDALLTASERCLADLRTRLAETFGMSLDVPWRPMTAPAADIGWRTYRVDADGLGPLLRVAASDALIARWRRGTLPAVEARDPLGALAAALADQSVAVSAFVGRCGLTASELATLSAGDVVMLDRAIGEPVELSVDAGRGPMRGTIRQLDDRLQLTIV
ncbi:FliM/FliN family flagellar motor switch protein [uncultured Sphingomonas sp.]|uniref:FliM/FliN family flagellar motor switch protein n=1 Tax=uncultured Sphingomonas sp. TaxID=158754 RepID=UPI0035C975F7